MNIIELNAATQVAGIVKKPIKDVLLRLKGDTEIALAFDAYKQNDITYITAILFNNSDTMKYNVDILSKTGISLCNNFFLPPKQLIKQDIFKVVPFVYSLCGAQSLDEKVITGTPNTTIALVIDDKQYDIDIDIAYICRFMH